ncbi:MAG: endonuclease/exonuclease/phosphatase family protein [Bacteroidetes bacterium]|nr:endonuclease/exonuclease/phosphatase family protein [Bacteroidota bacterium]
MPGRKYNPFEAQVKPRGIRYRLSHERLLLLNLLVILPVLLSQLALYIPATRWSIPNVLALALPWLLLPYLIWLGVWLIRRRWKCALLNLFLLSLAWPQITRSLQYNSLGCESSRDIRVVSFNVGAFSYRHKHWERTTEFLVNQKPDVVCLQEFHEVKILAPSYFESMKDRLGLDYHQFIPFSASNRFGLLLLSRYPIVDAGPVTEVDQKNGIMFADLDVGEDTIRVYNIHLESYRLNSPELGILFHNASHVAGQDPAAPGKPPKPPCKKGPSNQATKELLKHNWWQTARLILLKWQMHERQIALYRQHLSQWGNRPVIVCGDLNNTPYSYMYQQVRARLKDTFEERGRGMGKTYGTGLMAMRIDYVFASRQLKVLEHTPLCTNLSDHKGLLVRLRFPRKP